MKAFYQLPFIARFVLSLMAAGALFMVTSRLSSHVNKIIEKGIR